MTSAAHGRGTHTVLLQILNCLSVGTVHVASIAFEALSVTDEQMTLLRQSVYQPPDGRPCACFLLFEQGVKFADIACFSAFGPDVRLHKRPTLAHTDSDAFHILGFTFQIYVGKQTCRRLLGHGVCQRVCKHVVKNNLLLLDSCWANVFRV